MLHPFSLSLYNEFIEKTISKLQKMSVSLDEAENVRVIFNIALHNQLEDEAKHLLIMVAEESKHSLKPIALLLKYPNKLQTHRYYPP